jgi:para-nitrobenzyl esterase
MSDHTVVVKTALGQYEGTVLEGVASFKGISYARPPVGHLRFQAPEPVLPHEGIQPCFDYGPTAPKPPYPSPISELLVEPDIPGDDYLNLNVWTPNPGGSAEAEAGLPVLVWIHGGAFVYGSGAVSTHDGRRFARDGVVCVTINYRLGIDGFLLLDGVPANRGLLDQVAALEWVRDHVAAFGGDPGRVTVAGESAGAMSVGTLLAMPRAEGLFQQAVLQSGAASLALTERISRQVAARLAEALAIEPTAEAFAAVDPGELMAAQRRFSAELATQRDPAVWGELALDTMPFEPTIDGDVLPAAPIELIRAGAGSGVRVLTGTNRNEMTLFLAWIPPLVNAPEEALAPFAAGYGLSPEQAAIYRQAGPEATAGELIMDVVGDWLFRIPALRLAEARSSTAGETAGNGTAVTYVYELGWRTPQREGRLGATHGLDVAFVFDTLDDPGGEPLLGPNPPQRLADEMHGAWVAFIGTGDPGWPAYREDRQVKNFNTESAVLTDPRAQTRAVWDGIR